jgi:sugar-specific transcriptional regulator TrmB
MKQDTYQSLGLSPNEWKIYEKLVELGESSIGDISVAAQIHRRNVYDAMQRLIQKGLCFEIFSSKENLYNAVDPNKLMELLKEKEEQIQEMLPELKKKFRNRCVTEEAYIYRGYEGQKNIWRDIIRVEEPSYFIGAKGSWFDPELETARKAFFREANKKKIKFIQLFDHEIQNVAPGFIQRFPGKLQYRILPAAYATDSAINVFGDYVATYTGVTFNKMNKDVMFFVLHSKQLADSYRKWFQYMWDQSKEHK